jgi:hypothetical protein
MRIDEHAAEYEANRNFHKFLENISEWAPDAHTERLMRSAANHGFTVASKFCESPIEGMAVAGILAGYAIDIGGLPRVVNGKTGATLIEHVESPRAKNYFGPTTLTLQKPVQPFRADLVYQRTTRSKPVVLECDGQKYHGTPEQKQKDRRRDAFFERLGYQVERIKGGLLNFSPLIAWKAVDPRCTTYDIEWALLIRREMERAE